MKSHPYADIFPMMTEGKRQDLVADIKEKGLIDDIVTHDGQILDGRNRYQACLTAGVEPRFREYSGNDPLGFVMSVNLERRHLTPSQCADAAAKAANLKHGGERGNQYTGGKSPIGDLAPTATQTRNEMAKAFGVSTGSIDRAKRVQREAPELAEKVASGEMTVHAAHKIVKDAYDAKAAKHTPTSAPVAPPPVAPPITKLPKWIPDDAERLWLLAKTDLDKILPEDRSRERVLHRVVEYAQARIKNNK
jgi:hypothetical protein